VGWELVDLVRPIGWTRGALIVMVHPGVLYTYSVRLYIYIDCYAKFIVKKTTKQTETHIYASTRSKDRIS
jgi:hypothetical protein